MKWDGGLEISGGRIVGAEPLNIFTAKYGIDAWDAGSVAWRSVTSGQEEGVLLDIDAPDDAEEWDGVPNKREKLVREWEG